MTSKFAIRSPYGGECKHKWYSYFVNGKIDYVHMRHACGGCYIERGRFEELERERLQRLEQEGITLPKGSRRIRAISQVDTNIFL